MDLIPPDFFEMEPIAAIPVEDYIENPATSTIHLNEAIEKACEHGVGCKSNWPPASLASPEKKTTDIDEPLTSLKSTIKNAIKLKKTVKDNQKRRNKDISDKESTTSDDSLIMPPRRKKRATQRRRRKQNTPKSRKSQSLYMIYMGG